MGLKDGLKEAWKKHEQRQAQRAMGPMMDQITRNILTAEEELLRAAGDVGRRLIMAKWRMTSSTGWKPGDIPRRPITAQQLADLATLDVEKMRAFDEKAVEMFRALLEARYNKSIADMFAWLTVPIDEAQAWWDEKYGEGFHPDGGFLVTCERCRTQNRVTNEAAEGNPRCVNCGAALA